MILLLGCTKYSLLIDVPASPKPIINPVYLQALHAVNYVLN